MLDYYGGDAMRCSGKFTPVMLLLSMVLLATPAAHAGGTGLIQVGNPFPALVFPSAEDGSPQSLAAYAGRKVVLHVFASW